MEYEIIRVKRTVSTNLDAVGRFPGTVIVAEEQTGGRGRLDHKWHSKAGENLLMSVVLGVADAEPMEVATLPLVVGLAVRTVTGGKIKWPNDVYLNEKKICGILCERHEDSVIAGIGVNVRQREFPAELADKASSLLLEGQDVSVEQVMTQVLGKLSEYYARWRAHGFAALHSEFAAVDFLKGREVSIFQQDCDEAPIRGNCWGIAADGGIIVGEKTIYAGEVRYGRA